MSTTTPPLAKRARRAAPSLTAIEAMRKRTHFARLSVTSSATTDEINKVYRKLVLQYHPDKIAANPKREELTEIFKLISESRTVLCDEQKRLEYETELDLQRTTSNPYDGVFQTSTRDFEQLLRQQRATAGCKYGASVLTSKPYQARVKPQARRETLALTLEQIDRGIVLQYSYEKIINGCPYPTQHVISVKVPYGAQDGERIVVEGAGDEYPNKEAGDIFFFVTLRQHAVFHKRIGSDLYMQHTLTSPQQLIEGCTIRFKSVSGQRVESRVEPPIRNNSRVRLRGHGMRVRQLATGEPDDDRGDVVVLLKLADNWCDAPK